MGPDRKALFARLHALGIPTTTVEHAPMFTVEQSASLRAQTPRRAYQEPVPHRQGRPHGARRRQGRYAGRSQGAGQRGSAPGGSASPKAELLEAVLGVAAGSVTPLALINPSAADVIVVVDAALLDFAEVNCHPLVNTATTRLATQDLIRFIAGLRPFAPHPSARPIAAFGRLPNGLAPAHLAGLESRGA